VTRDSHALGLDKRVFTLKSPRAIARSLKRSARKLFRKGKNPQAA
jgi:Protein of unknown function (DUF3175)